MAEFRFRCTGAWDGVTGRLCNVPDELGLPDRVAFRFGAGDTPQVRYVRLLLVPSLRWGPDGPEWIFTSHYQG